MPKTPILRRTYYFARNLDGSFRQLPWGLVNTSLGAMAEPVPVSSQDWLTQSGGLAQLDQLDDSFNHFLEVDEASMLSVLGTYGPTVLADLNNPLP